MKILGRLMVLLLVVADITVGLSYYAVMGDTFWGRVFGAVWITSGCL